MDERRPEKPLETAAGPADVRAKHRRLAVVLVGVVIGMVGLSYAAVPLYQLFCQVTGFGGTTQRAEQGSTRITDRKVIVRFDGNIADGLQWRFKAVRKTMEVKVGENALAFYTARNFGPARSTATATFNVTPERAGIYFNKVECFCFIEQALGAGESTEMPVMFFVDADFASDPEMDGIDEIVLSYTFFPIEDDETSKVGAVAGDKKGS